MCRQVSKRTNRAAWDFDTDRHLAAGMTATRGVENGYAVVRASRDGLLVWARVGTPMATAYTQLGNWWGWLCVAGGAGLLALARRRTPPPAPASLATAQAEEAT